MLQGVSQSSQDVGTKELVRQLVAGAAAASAGNSESTSAFGEEAQAAVNIGRVKELLDKADEVQSVGDATTVGGSATTSAVEVATPTGRKTKADDKTNS